MMQDHDEMLMGVNWLGPVPTEVDHSVHVNDLPEYLSREERETLWQHIAIYVASTTLSDESMLHSYAVAKHYIYHVLGLD